jgi:hypothetical protein
MANPILIAVPEHLVPQVARLIASDPGPEQPQSSDDGLVNGWTEAKLRTHYGASSEKMRAFLVYLAEHSDREVQSHEAAKAIGFPDWNSVAGMLGAAQRRAKNHYGLKHGPWDRRWARDDQVRLKMPAAAAAVILDEAARRGER